MSDSTIHFAILFKELGVYQEMTRYTTFTIGDLMEHIIDYLTNGWSIDGGFNRTNILLYDHSFRRVVWNDDSQPLTTFDPFFRVVILNKKQTDYAIHAPPQHIAVWPWLVTPEHS